jgi:hypothetical protein
VLETEPECFDCTTCPVAQQQATLDTANVEAWGVYQRMQSRFAVDFHLTADLFRAIVAGWPPEDVADVMERLSVMHDVFSPPRATE